MTPIDIILLAYCVVGAILSTYADRTVNWGSTVEPLRIYILISIVFMWPGFVVAALWTLLSDP